jgi:hypothetical protein
LVVEAGGLGERPVYFRLHGPWSGDHRTVSEAPRADASDVVTVLIVIGVLAGGVALALRNHRRSRTDTRGAGRLAVLLLIMPVLSWIFGTHHAPLPNSLLNRFFEALAIGALFALFCIVLYLALEPVVRRIWPQVMIGWTRLLRGSGRDPMVGRSVLLGGAMFGATSLLLLLEKPLQLAFGLQPSSPGGVNWWAMATPRVLVGSLAMELPTALFNALFFLMLLVLLRLLLRRRWPTYIAFLLLSTLALVPGFRQIEIGLVIGSIMAVLWTMVLVRGGMLAFFVGFYLWRVADNFPLTFDFTQMYASASLFLMAAIVLVLVLALGSSLGGRSFLREDDS